MRRTEILLECLGIDKAPRVGVTLPVPTTITVVIGRRARARGLSRRRGAGLRASRLHPSTRLGLRIRDVVELDVLADEEQTFVRQDAFGNVPLTALLKPVGTRRQGRILTSRLAVDHNTGDDHA